MKEITLGDLSRMLDAADHAANLTPWYNPEPYLTYVPCEGDNRAAILDRVNDIMQQTSLEVSGSHRLPAWERGWGEILALVAQEGITYENLRPQYFKHDIMRINGDYAQVDGKNFEFSLCHAIKTILYKKWLMDDDSIIDIGTGTGSNVYLLLKLFSSARVTGCDWALPSCSLVEQIGKAFGGRAQAVQLNMLDLTGFDLLGSLEGRAVVSVHAFEQLGTGFHELLERVVKGRPRICVQIEPLDEFYEENDFDQTAASYHQKRGYLTGYLSALRNLEKAGRIEIMQATRLPFGNMLHEPYGILVWRPL